MCGNLFFMRFYRWFSTGPSQSCLCNTCATFQLQDESESTESCNYTSKAIFQLDFSLSLERCQHGLTVRNKINQTVFFFTWSLLFSDITAKEFMEQRGGLRSRYELLRDFLSEMLSVAADDVNIFSLIEVRDRTLDVRFSVYSIPFQRAERLHGYLAAHKQKVRFLFRSLVQLHTDIED